MHATFVTCECDTTNYEVSYVLRIGIIYLRQLNLHNTWCTLHLWCVHWSMLSLHLSLCHSATSFGHKYLSHTTLSDVGVHRTWMPTLSGCWGGSPILHLVKVTLYVPQRDNCFTPFIEKKLFASKWLWFDDILYSLKGATIDTSFYASMLVWVMSRVRGFWNGLGAFGW